MENEIRKKLESEKLSYEKPFL